MMKEIEEFKQLVNEKLYYDAHETLEELWFPIRKMKNNYCLVLKGFINAAVSLELYKRNKITQSKKIYLVYLKYVTDKRINCCDHKEELKKLKVFIDIYFKTLENSHKL
ncbi:hypothetical protein ALC152_05770 [Arcobacter sp. 15-2]|uniref:DUF309 domain-containing protein n=1 Tax=Arcobacter sp. 15-2 TaxID=3374109 RepID=UPI00399CE1A4